MASNQGALRSVVVATFVLAIALIIVLQPIATTPRADAADPAVCAATSGESSFCATAAAGALHVGYQVREYILTDQLVQIEAPSALARIDALESRGWAANPYPGETVLAAPGLAGIPADYPLIAQSRYPANPTATVSNGPVTLSSESDETSSKSSAAFTGAASNGVSVATATADASVIHDLASGRVTSEASTVAGAIEVAEVLRIGRIYSNARYVSPASGSPVSTTQLVIDGASIAGQSVEITPQGIVAAGTTQPLPSTNTLTEALKSANIEVTYLAPVKEPNGIVAPGLEITFTHPIPNAPNPGIWTVTFGRALATGRGGGIGILAGGVDAGTGSNVGAGSAPTATVSDNQPPAGVVVPPAPEVQPQAPRTGPVAAPITSSRTLPTTLSFYLMLVLGAVLVFGGMQALRFFGVKAKWAS